jgi:hypothetical protein
MPETKPSAAEREDVIARELGLPSSIVHNSLRKLKETGRIAGRRPVSPPLTSRDLARIILGLAAPLPVNAPGVEQTLGSLPRTSGDGAVNAETEIVDLLDEAAGTVHGNIDFRTGDILISANGDFLAVSGERDGVAFNRTYRRNVQAEGMQRIARIPLQILRRIALQLF